MADRPPLLHDQTALVTGASSGIGAASAVALARAGAQVGINYHHDIDGADRVVRQVHDLGGQALALKADVSNEDDVKAMFGQFAQTFGRLDILVVNAGL